ncbi:MAG TPA: histidine--tRNA ligase [Patescibacteria group bacterium]
MPIQALRGFRDFYPEDQATITYLREKIAASCAKFGYEEFEGPMLESIDLYAAKSSEEIVNEQAFTLEDRGGDRITLRPELTPTLARMVAAKQQQLTFPLRWWCFGRFWRYERPQKGRGREFYQWNLDLLGQNTADADAEIIEISIDFLQSVGVTSDDVVFEINDRSFAEQLLRENNIDTEKTSAVFQLVDRLAKLNSEEKLAFGLARGLSESDVTKITELFSAESTAWEQSERIQALLTLFENKGLSSWVRPNLSIVRGFTYYTGLVFEVTVKTGQSRALLGGGRYSNLVSDMGGQPVEGVGMGMGDMSIAIFLEEKGLLPEYTTSTKACVIGLGPDTAAFCQEVATTLRNATIPTILYGTPENFGKGLKFAGNKKIPYALLIGPDELLNKTVTLKNLETGEQETSSLETILEKLT